MIKQILTLEQGVILDDSIGIYTLVNDQPIFQCSTENIVAWSVFDDGIWLKNTDGQTYKLGDHSQAVQPEYEVYPFFVAQEDEWTLSDEYLSWRASILSLVNTETGEIFQLKERFIDARIFKKQVYLTIGKQLQAYSTELQKIWASELFENRSYKTTHFTNLTSLNFYGPFVIINIGIDEVTRVGHIVALSTADGSEAWRFAYQGEPQFSFLSDEYFYIVDNGVITRLNAKTGELVSVMTPGLGQSIVVVANADELIIGSNEQKTLNRYSLADNKIIASVPIPEHYRFHIFGVPFETDSTVYFHLEKDHPNFQYSSKALLSVDRSDTFEQAIDQEPLLTLPMMVTADAKGEIVYLFTVSCESLEDLKRLAAITLAEYAYTYGEPGSVIPSMTPDKKHKGKMKLVVDGSALPENAEEELNNWTTALANNFAKMLMHPGAGEKYRFNIEIVMS